MNPNRKPVKRRGYVFISFKTEDVDRAGSLRKALVNLGFDVWWQQDLQCGKVWASQLDEAVRGAGCIVVLWSARSLTSPWVKHEASQGMARDVYAPARIEAVDIDRPFDQIQAADLIDWKDGIQTPGFDHLLTRVEALVPVEFPWWVRLRRAAWQRAATIGAALLAGLALLALGVLASRGADVLARQELLSTDMYRMTHPIGPVEVRAEIAVDHDAPGIAPYMDWLHAEMTGEPLEKHVRAGDAELVSNGRFRLSRSKSLWPVPDISSRQAAWYVQSMIHFQIDFNPFYREPGELPPKQSTLPTEGRIAFTLEVGSKSTEAAADDDYRSVLYDPAEKQLVILIHDSSPEIKTPSGGVVSTIDLLRTHLGIKFPLIIDAGGGDKGPDSFDPRKGIHLRSLTLNAAHRSYSPRMLFVAPDASRMYTARLGE